MSKKIKVILFVLVIAAILLLAIYFVIPSANLDKVSLTLDDLKDEGYEEFEKEHITEPYNAPNTTLFGGWKILEKYHVRFSKNDTCFIVIDIGKLESRNKGEEFISRIKNTTFIYDYTEIESETIGEESYIGEDNTTIFGLKVTLYFIVFRIDNIVVAMASSGHTLQTSIDYAKIIENKILSN